MEKTLGVFSALADRTRLRLYRLLLDAGTEVCVCELIDALRENQYNVSKHLRILKGAGLVKEKRMGRWIMYSAAGCPVAGLQDAVKGVGDAQFDSDAGALKKRLSLRRDGMVVTCCIKKEKKGGSK